MASRTATNGGETLLVHPEGEWEGGPGEAESDSVPDERTQAEIDFLMSGATSLPGRSRQVEVAREPEPVSVEISPVPMNTIADELTRREIHFLQRAEPRASDLRNLHSLGAGGGAVASTKSLFSQMVSGPMSFKEAFRLVFAAFVILVVAGMILTLQLQPGAIGWGGLVLIPLTGLAALSTILVFNR